MTVLVTCEHGGVRIPDIAATCFGTAKANTDLQHRICDFGAQAAAHAIAQYSNYPLITCEISPLVIDVNRSIRNPRLLSSYTKTLNLSQRTELLDRWYYPYRQQVEATVLRLLDKYRYIIHVAVHSFPPIVEGKAKRADVGLLYDPAREDELDLCLDWADVLYIELPFVRVRRNYPTRGTADSLAKVFRKTFSPDQYLGIELHLNQAWCCRNVAMQQDTLQGLARSLAYITGTTSRERSSAA